MHVQEAGFLILAHMAAASTFNRITCDVLLNVTNDLSESSLWFPIRLIHTNSSYIETITRQHLQMAHQSRIGHCHVLILLSYYKCIGLHCFHLILFVPGVTNALRLFGENSYRKTPSC